MPAAIPIIAAIAVGSAAAAGAYAVAAVITIASAVATAALTKKNAGGSYKDQSERKQVLRASASPKTVVYGEVETSGTLFFSEEEPGNQTKNERLYLAITMAGHELSGIKDVYLADSHITDYGSNAEFEFHNNRATVDPYLLANAPSWKDDMIGKGVAWLRVTLRFNAEKFPAGIPNVKVRKLGWAVYDPRTGETKYSNNAALVILHFYRHYLNVPDNEINWDQFQEAANICDELVYCGDDKTEPRYTINGEWDLSETKSAVLDEMLASCAGDPTYIGGRHGLLVGAYYGPAIYEINEDQLAGDIEIMPEVSQRERVNTIKGTFIDPLQGFSEVDFPIVTVDEWLKEDGVEISQDMKLRFVTSEFQAQRLADIKLKRTRISRTMNLPLNLSGYIYRPGMYVIVNIPSIGITGVEMRVTDWKFSITKGVTLTVKEESAEVWNDAIGQPITRPPLTELPTGGVAQPQALAYTVEEIGDVVQGILSWQNVGAVAYNTVTVRKAGELVMSVQAPDTTARLSGLVRGVYTAHVVAVNFMGARSPEAMIEFVIQAPDAPSFVRVEQGYFSITLYPQSSQLANVSTQFDFWTSGETRLDNANTATVEQYATRTGIGSFFTSNGLKNGYTYYWYIRSVNAFGASAFLEVEVLCQTETGELLEEIEKDFSDSEVIKNLQGGINSNIDAIINNSLATGEVAFNQWKQYGEVRAEIMVVTTTIATVDEAMSELSVLVKAEFENQSAQILQVSKAVSNAEESVSKLENYVQAQNENVLAAVNQKFDAYVKSDGTAGAFYTLNLGIEFDDVKYNCGMAFGIEPKDGGYESTVAFAADRFGIYSGNDPGNYKLVFVIVNGQTYIDEAYIREGTITNAKIANEIFSLNYIKGVSGWYIGKNGYAEFNDVIVRGTIYATDGYFKGTLEATRFVGDIAVARVYPDLVATHTTVNPGVSGGGPVTWATREIIYTPTGDAEMAITLSTMIRLMFRISNGSAFIKFDIGDQSVTREIELDYKSDLAKQRYLEWSYQSYTVNIGKRTSPVTCKVSLCINIDPSYASNTIATGIKAEAVRVSGTGAFS